MNESEIIKALECHTGNNSKRCQACPYTIYGCYCLDHLHPDLLDLISRKKAEIERLEKENEFCHKTITENAQRALEVTVEEIEKTKSEAIKEFAERLKDELRLDDDCGYHCYDCCYECKDYVPVVDNLVKEMTEEYEDE